MHTLHKLEGRLLRSLLVLRTLLHQFLNGVVAVVPALQPHPNHVPLQIPRLVDVSRHPADAQQILLQTLVVIKLARMDPLYRVETDP